MPCAPRVDSQRVAKSGGSAVDTAGESSSPAYRTVHWRKLKPADQFMTHTASFCFFPFRLESWVRGGGVPRVVVCGVVLGVSCVVWCCSYCVFVCVTCFSSYFSVGKTHELLGVRVNPDSEFRRFEYRKLQVEPLRRTWHLELSVPDANTASLCFVFLSSRLARSTSC